MTRKFRKNVIRKNELIPYFLASPASMSFWKMIPELSLMAVLIPSNQVEGEHQIGWRRPKNDPGPQILEINIIILFPENYRFKVKPVYNDHP
jgi:hypothetical protein